jgi:hypothetical protein
MKAESEEYERNAEALFKRYEALALSPEFQAAQRCIFRCHALLGNAFNVGVGKVRTQNKEEIAYLDETLEKDRKLISERMQWEAFFTVHEDHPRQEEIMALVARHEKEAL